MYKIYIDTSKRYESILRLFNNDLFLEEKSGDFDIVTEISILLKKYNIPHDDVLMDYFEGPGESFTGLKIGSAISNTFNFAIGKITSKEVKLPNYGREPNITKSVKTLPI